MVARLIRWARLRLKEIRTIGFLAALAVLADVGFTFNPSIEERFPWVAHNLGHGVHLLEVIEALLTVSAAAIILRFYFGRRRPPPGPLGLLHFLLMPGAPDSAQFKFRVAQVEADLEPFVRLSDAEVDIANRHPELYGPGRWALYNEWFRIRPQSFLLLDRFDPKSGAWGPIAVSIVLPLTSAGANRLRGGATAVVEMRDLEIASDGTPSSEYLIDTWIVKKAGQARYIDRPIREPHRKYARALLFVHLGVFWDARSPATFLVEADNPHIRDVCQHLGFDGSIRTKDGEILQQLSFPPILRTRI